MSDLKDLVKNDIPAPTNDAEVEKWLKAKMSLDHPFLLAHADDGVIWGKWTNGAIYTSHEIAPNISPPLLGKTLQQAFIFGAKSEIRLFRDELGEWTAREISNPASTTDYIIEWQILWGSEVVQMKPQVDALLRNEFTHVRDKRQQGLDQVLPIPITQAELDIEPADKAKRPRLLVHHFIEYNDCTGEARIGLSRLVNVAKLDDAETA
ncbi:TIGR03984 family CRISPR-associated protein [candidate division KSB1 bacterium]|nr:MAG: TIGR03984 family CRISPR-associated protein [candidate division KSB1 bacterium]